MIKTFIPNNKIEVKENFNHNSCLDLNEACLFLTPPSQNKKGRKINCNYLVF